MRVGCPQPRRILRLCRSRLTRGAKGDSIYEGMWEERAFGFFRWMKGAATMRCPKCNQKLVMGARFCHQCGAELPPEIVEKTISWYYDPTFVLLAIFLALAIFGLPLLWKSPRFTEWQKVVVSIVTVIYTAVILWFMYYLIFVLLIPHFRELGTVLGSTM